MKKNKNIETFKNKMVELREVLGWSQSKLGKKAVLCTSAISHFETGKRIPCLVNAVKIADAFDVSLDWLLGRK